jgi:pilus assembly protein TadC
MVAATLGRPARGGRKRLGSVLPATASRAATSSPPGRSFSPLRVIVAAAVLVAGLVAVGGIAGLVIGAVGASLISLVARPQRPEMVPPDDVPVVVDLIAGCLAVGATLPEALDAAARAAPVRLRQSCQRVAAALRSGAPAEEAWESWLDDPSLAPVARSAIRTASSGAATAAEFIRASTRLRARRRARAQYRIRQASVWLVAPLGLCFLPAFVLVAVVPMVMGLLPSLR